MMRRYLYIALRNVFRHKLRTTMTIAAIVFCVAGLIITGGFVRDIYIQLGEALIHSQSGHLQILRAGYYESGTKSPEKFLIQDAGSLRKTITAMPGVEDVMGRIMFAGLLNNGQSDLAVIGEGVEPDKEHRLGSNIRILTGRPLADGDRYGVVLGQGVAQALRVAPGDRVTLLLNTAQGALDSLDLEVVGVMQTFSKEFDAHAIRIPLAEAQRILDTEGVNTLVVSLTATEDTDRLVDLLRARLQGLSLEVRSWKTLNDFYEKTVALYERQFGVLRLITLILVFLTVANSVNMGLLERTGEFGTMRALGNPNGNVFLLIVAESAMLAAVASTLGAVVGVAFALLLSAVGIPMPPPPNSESGYTAMIRLAPETIASAWAIGFVATLLAAVNPAQRAVRTPVVDALRQNA
jgi:putative ABC transport system permease protein